LERFNVFKFSRKLAELGVISKRTAASVEKIAGVQPADPRFRSAMEEMFREVSEWNDKAEMSGYCDPACVTAVKKGIDCCLKYSKKNINRESLDDGARSRCKDKLDSINMQYMPEGDEMRGVNIRDAALETVDACRRALTERQSQRENEHISAALGTLGEIEKYLSAVVDCRSKDAARRQRDIFNSLNTWAATCLTGNIRGDQSTRALSEALKRAVSWAGLRMNVRNKAAAPEDVKTVGELDVNVINFANAYENVCKINDVIERVEVQKKVNAEITATDFEQEQRSQYTAEKQAAEERKDRAYMEMQSGKLSMEEAYEIMTECDAEINMCKKEIRLLDDSMRRSRSSARIFKIEHRRITGIFRNLLKYRGTPELLNEFCKNIDFVAINEFLNGSTDDLVIDKVVNLKAMSLTAERLMSISAEKFIDALDNEDKIYEENESTVTVEHELSQEEKLAKMREYMANAGMTGGDASYRTREESFANFDGGDIRAENENVRRATVSSDDN